jgi:predicted nucleotidyltransferase
VIGSVARGDANSGSDIDLLIQADEDVTLLDLILLRHRLAAMLGVPVDLVDPSERAAGFENLEAEALRLCP